MIAKCVIQRRGKVSIFRIKAGHLCSIEYISMQSLYSIRLWLEEDSSHEEGVRVSLINKDNGESLQQKHLEKYICLSAASSFHIESAVES